MTNKKIITKITFFAIELSRTEILPKKLKSSIGKNEIQKNKLANLSLNTRLDL